MMIYNYRTSWGVGTLFLSLLIICGTTNAQNNCAEEGVTSASDCQAVCMGSPASFGTATANGVTAVTCSCGGVSFCVTPDEPSDEPALSCAAEGILNGVQCSVACGSGGSSFSSAITNAGTTSVCSCSTSGLYCRDPVQEDPTPPVEPDSCEAVDITTDDQCQMRCTDTGSSATSESFSKTTVNGFTTTQCACEGSNLIICKDVREAESQPVVGFGCFPNDALVQVEGSTVAVTMKDLKLGDRVLVDASTKQYETIYSFGHRSEDSTHEFLQLTLAANNHYHDSSRRVVLVITKDHMVVTDDGRSVPAGMIQVGDSLQSGGDVDDDTILEVMAIESIYKKGAFAPFTQSGVLVVNEVKVSSYIAFQESETLTLFGWLDTGLTFQFLAHAFEFPHRLWCRGGCVTETYTPQGISTWVDGPHKALRWFL